MRCVRPAHNMFDPWVGKILWRRERQPIPVFLSGESYGQRSLEGYSPWHPKELDMTESLPSISRKRPFLRWAIAPDLGLCSPQELTRDDLRQGGLDASRPGLLSPRPPSQRSTATVVSLKQSLTSGEPDLPFLGTFHSIFLGLPRDTE